MSEQPPLDTRVPSNPDEAMAMVKDALMGVTRFPETGVDLMPTPIDGYWEVNLQWVDGPAFTLSMQWARQLAVVIDERGPERVPVIEYQPLPGVGGEMATPWD